MSVCLITYRNYRIAMKQTSKSFESLYMHDYMQFRAISESFFYWINLSFCIALEQQKVCSLVFLVFRKYQLWIALSIFLGLFNFKIVFILSCSNKREFTTCFQQLDKQSW